MSVVVSSEFHTQKRLIKDCLINNLGYEYLGNLHDQSNKPVDEERLERYLYSRGYPRLAVVKAIKELKDLTEDRVSSLYELNKRIYSLLRYGITYREPGQKDKRLHYIDWQQPELNRFAVAEEVTVRYTTGKKSKRPDIVLYVNGIALGMFELKKSCVEASQGIRQLITNQKPEYISGFFTTQQLLFAGNETQGLFYGTIETPEKFYLQWREDPKASDETSIEVCRLHDQTKNPCNMALSRCARSTACFRSSTTSSFSMLESRRFPAPISSLPTWQLVPSSSALKAASFGTHRVRENR